MAYSQVELAEKLVTLEKDSEYLAIKVSKHDAVIEELDEKLDKIIEQVSGIKVALIFMAVCIAGNIPALQPAVNTIIKLLF